MSRRDWLCACLLVSGVALAEQKPAALPEVLQGRLDVAYGPVWKSGDAARFVDEFLTPDAVVTASDASTVWSGHDQSVVLLKDLMKSYKAIGAKAVYTRQVAPNVAFQFVEFHLTPRDPAQKPSLAKSLYVWIKTDKGWRVTADHYSFVGMDAPKLK